MLVTPWLLGRMGAERFGLWSLLTVLAGTYTAFDLGLSGSLTKFVAEFRATGDRTALRAIYTQGALFYLGLGVLFFAVWRSRAAAAHRSSRPGSLITRPARRCWLRRPPTRC
jgi:O-antigen/teichoic acid export membrane protein